MQHIRLHYQPVPEVSLTIESDDPDAVGRLLDGTLTQLEAAGVVTIDEPANDEPVNVGVDLGRLNGDHTCIALYRNGVVVDTVTLDPKFLNL